MVLSESAMSPGFLKITVPFLLRTDDSAQSQVFPPMKAVKFSVQGTVFLPLSGHTDGVKS